MFSTQVHRRDARAANARRSGRSAFTLVELLVVIGIILVLMALLLPAVNNAWKAGVRTRMALDLQTISTALEAYRADFQQYPQVYTQVMGTVTNAYGQSANEQGGGAYWLCRALVGPGDQSTDGAGTNPNNSANSDTSPYGFRNAGSYNSTASPPAYTGGKIWGPYLPPDGIKMGDPTGANNPNNYVLFDRYKHPILYYPAKQGTNISVTDTSSNNPALPSGVGGWGGYLGPHGKFNPLDNSTSTGSSDSTTGQMSAQMFMILMGDGGYDNGSGSPTIPNGMIDLGETPAYEGNYVLVSAGTDELFGPIGTPGLPQQGPNWRASPVNPWDDVTNFPR